MTEKVRVSTSQPTHKGRRETCEIANRTVHLPAIPSSASQFSEKAAWDPSRLDCGWSRNSSSSSLTGDAWNSFAFASFGYWSRACRECQDLYRRACLCSPRLGLQHKFKRHRHEIAPRWCLEDFGNFISREICRGEVLPFSNSDSDFKNRYKYIYKKKKD